MSATPRNSPRLTAVSTSLGAEPTLQADWVGSGSGGGGNLEARIARLESDVEYIKRDIGELKDDVKELRRDGKFDFRVLFGAIIIATLGLAGLFWDGFHRLSDRTDAVAQEVREAFKAIEQRLPPPK